jgi:hypothetical protein
MPTPPVMRQNHFIGAPLKCVPLGAESIIELIPDRTMRPLLSTKLPYTLE